MLKLKGILVIATMLLLSSTSHANSWRTAYIVYDHGAEQCSYPYCRCTYEVNNFKFNVTMESSYCPAMIKIDAERGQWRRY